MKTQDFIESGILESYLLGLASGNEEVEVKQMIERYPEVSDYILDFESGIQHYFNSNAIAPPADTHEIIQLRSTKIEIFKKEQKTHDSDRNKGRENQYLDIEVNDTYIKVHKYWRPAFIAVFILSKIFLISGLYYYFQTSALEDEVVRLKSQINIVK